MTERKEVMFNIQTARRLRRAYEKAVADGVDEFVFDECPLLIDYAKYLLEYVEGELGINQPTK